MGFELKHFSPEALAKLAALNPHLAQELGVKDVDEEEYRKTEQELLKVMSKTNETWQKLEAAYLAQEKATLELLAAKKGKPLLSKGQLLAMILLFCLILVLI